jgi:hypothetical protein
MRAQPRVWHAARAGPLWRFRHRGGRGDRRQAAPPDRRQPNAPGREWEIVARDAESLAALIVEEAGARQRCRGVGGCQRAPGLPAGARGARLDAGAGVDEARSSPPTPACRPSARSRGWWRSHRRRPQATQPPWARDHRRAGPQKVGTLAGRKGSGAAAARRRPAGGISKQETSCPAVGGREPLVRAPGGLASRRTVQGQADGGEHAEAAGAWPGRQPPGQGGQPLPHAEQAVATLDGRVPPAPCPSSRPARSGRARGRSAGPWPWPARVQPGRWSRRSRRRGRRSPAARPARRRPPGGRTWPDLLPRSLRPSVASIAAPSS